MIKLEVKGLLIKPYTLNAQLYYLLVISNKNTYYRISIASC